MAQIHHCRAFCETVGDLELFPYQINFLKDCLKINRVIGIFGRQMGKTTIISLFTIYFSLQNDNSSIFIIAPTDRQAGELFDRIKSACIQSGLTSAFIDISTAREIRFKNGSRIRAMPTGDTGRTIRGMTADLIVLEESSYIKTQIVNQVIMPMIAAKGEKGRVIQIGTPFSKNHFYNASLSERYAVHKYDYTHCPLISSDFIEEQKKNTSELEFAMEYLAEFIDDSDCYFPTSLIQAATEDYCLISLNEVLP